MRNTNYGIRNICLKVTPIRGHQVTRGTQTSLHTEPNHILVLGRMGGIDDRC